MPMRRRRHWPESPAKERYEEMGIAAALSRPWDYPTACADLAAVLRLAYGELRKGTQALVVRDVLLAFRLLPEVRTGYAVSSANLLLQAVEAALPKQKKALAVSEYKHAIVAHKRRVKAQQETGSLFLPADVLIHIFSFLDMRSLLAVGLVCWAWNLAASDNTLWKIHYFMFFDDCHARCSTTSGACPSVPSRKDFVSPKTTDPILDPSFLWKRPFQSKFASYSSLASRSSRAICRRCRSMIWLTSMTCATPHYCSKIGKQEQKIEPILPDKVAAYILHDRDPASSDSDDSDSDGYLPMRKFWSFLDL